MRIIVTGSPGVGKTSVSKELGKRLKCLVFNEKQFALEKGIGKWDEEQDELIIPLGEFSEAIEGLFQREKNAIVEGHLLCEIRLKPDFVVLIRLGPELLESRLEARGYSAEKVQDNVFCEGIDYCKKHVERNYSKEKIVEIRSGKTIKETLHRIVKGLKEKGAEL
jgi:adenylate kinase